MLRTRVSGENMCSTKTPAHGFNCYILMVLYGFNLLVEVGGCWAFKLVAGTGSRPLDALTNSTHRKQIEYGM